MNPIELARWQWSDYTEFHANRRNLLTHIVAVPLFLLGNLLLVLGTWYPLWLMSGTGFSWDLWTLFLLPLLGLLMSAGAMAWQGAGHGKEAKPPKPFTGPGNALGRILLEQWFTFPRFVVTGGWWRALKTVSATGSTPT